MVQMPNTGQVVLHQPGSECCVEAKTFVDVTANIGRVHSLHVHVDDALHFDVVELVDLKNFTAVFHDGVQAVGRLRLVRVRNHAEGEPVHVTRA